MSNELKAVHIPSQYPYFSGCHMSGEHSTAYLTSRSYSIQLCNYYIIIYTMLLLRSLKDNYRKITPPSIVVLMVQWIRNSAFNQESGVRFPAGELFHEIKLKFKKFLNVK